MNKVLATIGLTTAMVFGLGCASVGGLVHDLSPKLEDFGESVGVSLTVDPTSLVDSVVVCVPKDSGLAGIPFLGEALVSLVGECPVEEPPAEEPVVE
jgi:hypothetical protein